METFIGWILIITAITFFSWFIYGKDEFTVKENVRNFLLSEIFLIIISIGAYMITGGNWKMNRTTKVNILSYASQPDKDIDYDGDIIVYKGKRYYVNLAEERVEFLGISRWGAIMAKYIEIRVKDTDFIKAQIEYELWGKIIRNDKLTFVDAVSLSKRF